MSRTITRSAVLLGLGLTLTACAQHNPAQANCFNFRDPNSATNFGSLVPFFVMVFLAKGFVAATPLMVRRISGNLMVAAAPAIVSGSAGVLRRLVNTSRVQSKARIGALTTGEAIGQGAVQAPAAVRSAAVTASAQVVRIAEKAKRLGR